MRVIVCFLLEKLTMRDIVCVFFEKLAVNKHNRGSFCMSFNKSSGRAATAPVEFVGDAPCQG